jgi:3alpha(or 20beta)-hydroxysteroid dehydrogenase
MDRLSGKVAIITGAAQGMGAEHARTFINEGAKVILTTASNVDAGQTLADELGPNAVFIKHNVSNPNDWKAVIAIAENKFGPVNVLVNNAGVVGPIVGTVEFGPEDYEAVCATNQTGVFFGMQATIPSMLKAGGGSIINVSSIAGIISSYGATNLAYVGSKFAVRGMTKFVALEYGKKNIRVNSVHPGGIATSMMVSALGGSTDNEIANTFKALIPMDRFGDPSEVSQLLVFLASDESSYITGTEQIIDGGFTAR